MVAPYNLSAPPLRKDLSGDAGKSLDENTAEQFAQGVQLHNEKELTRPAVLEVITPTEVRLTISEGRYHQVKRMFAAVGNHVVRPAS
ncbi:Ribosomal small subunit pseudouridine synthase A [Raoultella terrigena]|uniref:Ribosomal small subunit pseudouridine synthase A n=1 Tax=Raoultella terrigena TaxID=577 RepID=A0A3P8IU97_RAOTE|nr:Ribosomal small subunit pseudouridine synthase A [Raoultella terrigena]